MNIIPFKTFLADQKLRLAPLVHKRVPKVSGRCTSDGMLQVRLRRNLFHRGHFVYFPMLEFQKIANAANFLDLLEKYRCNASTIVESTVGGDRGAVVGFHTLSEATAFKMEAM